MLKLPTKPNPTLINPSPNKTSDDNLPNGQKSVIVKLENVRKTYTNGAVGLRDVSLELYKGDFKFITGHSGSGKSTLLKLLYGAEQATDGDVFVNGFNL
ncbi:MAG: cell-division ATP-binding protein, partial [Cyanobacteriota bacterium]